MDGRMEGYVQKDMEEHSGVSSAEVHLQIQKDKKINIKRRKEMFVKMQRSCFRYPNFQSTEGRVMLVPILGKDMRIGEDETRKEEDQEVKGKNGKQRSVRVMVLNLHLQYAFDRLVGEEGTCVMMMSSCCVLANGYLGTYVKGDRHLRLIAVYTVSVDIAIVDTIERTA